MPRLPLLCMVLLLSPHRGTPTRALRSSVINLMTAHRRLLSGTAIASGTQTATAAQAAQASAANTTDWIGEMETPTATISAPRHGQVFNSSSADGLQVRFDGRRSNPDRGSSSISNFVWTLDPGTPARRTLPDRPVVEALISPGAHVISLTVRSASGESSAEADTVRFTVRASVEGATPPAPLGPGGTEGVAARKAAPAPAPVPIPGTPGGAQSPGGTEDLVAAAGAPTAGSRGSRGAAAGSNSSTPTLVPAPAPVAAPAQPPSSAVSPPSAQVRRCRGRGHYFIHVRPACTWFVTNKLRHCRLLYWLRRRHPCLLQRSRHQPWCAPVAAAFALSNLYSCLTAISVLCAMPHAITRPTTRTTATLVRRRLHL